MAESFATPAAFHKAAREVTEFHRFQELTVQLGAINEQICRLRSTEPDDASWTEAKKERLLLFIKKSHGKSRRLSR